MLGVNIWKQSNQCKVICWWFAVHELETTLQTNVCRNIYCQFIFTKIALKLEIVKTIGMWSAWGSWLCKHWTFGLVRGVWPKFFCQLLVSAVSKRSWPGVSVNSVGARAIHPAGPLQQPAPAGFSQEQTARSDDG